MNELKKNSRASRIGGGSFPSVGDWVWVRADGGGEKIGCVVAVRSNHVELGWAAKHGGVEGVYVRHEHWLEETRPAPDWREFVQRKIDQTQAEIAEAVKKLADTCAGARLVREKPGEPETMLPSTLVLDPSKHKQELLQLQNETLPQLQRDIESATKRMVMWQRDLFLSELFKSDAYKLAGARIKERLFALELYAGLWQEVRCIAKGRPAGRDEPVTVRQMLRYMDEETLIELDNGGMDFRDVQAFDKWVAVPENRDRVVPEQRCVVAFKVRRNSKDYGTASSLGEAFAHYNWNQWNKKTYLLVRNGEALHRLVADIDFEPRLIPLREELSRPLKNRWGDKEITPKDYEYDDALESRMEEVRDYNRVMFLLQGMLDRSDMLSPHPPIDLSKQDQVERHVRLVRDEEDGLPSSDPPSWERYRDSANESLRAGDHVYAVFDWEDRSCRWSDSGRVKKRNGIFQVTKVSRSRKTVRVSEPWGTRWGYEKRDGCGGYYGSWGEWPVNRMRHHTVKMEDVFNLHFYRLGDYKKFLCDAHLKGRYLEWARQLVAAEKWLQQQMAGRKAK